ncbi:tyrosine-type recombinase/integrase [Solirubrobacter ginsenosidimutans]|uniref:tyrosine-type recombinase/integrase n=1 Tax=Solirubrobacter ginsenosidimutans TaxID=490573 RepID=UPI0035591B62
MSGKLASAATAAWEKAGLQRITLHECRHTYASMLMAAHYTIKEIMEYMGHARSADGQPLRQAAPATT